jgi:cell division protein FtsW
MQKKSIDTPLVFLVLGLAIFGLVMISSVSVYGSFKLTSGMVAEGKLSEANNYFYLLRHIIHVLMGIGMMTIVSKIPYIFWEKNAKNLFGVMAFLLFIVLIVGEEYNGARGWLNIPGIPSVQPVEFMKIGLIVFLAYFIKKRRLRLSDFYEGFVPFFSIAA